MDKRMKRLVILFGAVLLAACQTPLPEPAVLPPPVPCPPVTVGVLAFHDSETTGALTGVEAMCHQFGGNLSVTLDIAFAASRRHVSGPAPLTLPYTVTIADAGGALRSHELYHVHMIFLAGAGSIAQHEHLHQVIPVTPGNALPASIVVGLASVQ